MTTKKRVEEAAFWDGRICLTCEHTTPEEGEETEGCECPACGRDSMVAAATLAAFLDRLEE
jgi:ssDNA-binding Zn-finger/Zn-ribbon topoisomerase 1